MTKKRLYGPNGKGRPAWNKLDPAEKLRRRRVQNKAWKANNPDKVAANIRKFYNYPEPMRPKPEACECCHKPPVNKGLNLDHDHKTGAFRGWLCVSCNTAIGKLGDTIEGVQRAILYLGRVA